MELFPVQTQTGGLERLSGFGFFFVVDVFDCVGSPGSLDTCECPIEFRNVTYF